MTKFKQILDEDEILITFCIIDDITKAMGMQGDKQQKMTKRSFDRRFYFPSLLWWQLPSNSVLLEGIKPIPFQEPSVKKPFHKKASSLVWSFALPFPPRLSTQAKNIPKFPLLH